MVTRIDSSAYKRAVVLVDDSLDVQSAFQVLAEINDFQLITASDGVEALGKMDKLGGDPSVLFVDLTMPIMGGLEFLHRLRERGLASTSHVVIFSGLDREVVQKLDRQCEWLAKPFKLNDIVNIISRVRR